MAICITHDTYIITKIEMEILLFELQPFHLQSSDAYINTEGKYGEDVHHYALNEKEVNCGNSAFK